MKDCARLRAAMLLGVFVTTGGFCATTQMPRAIVEEYCSLDARGANFSASNPNAESLWRLLINEDEAGYDESVIIQSYQVGKPKGSGPSADVEVTYADLGTIGGELEVKKDPRSERVVFHLTMTENGWKIDGLRQLPHISRGWMMAHLRGDIRRSARVGKSDPRLDSALAQINGW